MGHKHGHAKKRVPGLDEPESECEEGDNEQDVFMSETSSRPPAPNKTRTPWWKRFDEACGMVSDCGCVMIDSREDFVRGCKEKGKSYKPLLRCKSCKTEFRGACLNSMQQGQGAGCPTCTSNKQLWSGRYDEGCKLVSDCGCVMIDSHEDFVQGCKEKGCLYIPLLQCKTCKIEFRGASIDKMQQGQGAGCPSCTSNKQLWSGRYDEGCNLVSERGAEMADSHKDFVRGCKEKGCLYKPLLQCKTCNTEFRGACLHSMQHGQGAGCPSCTSNKQLWSGRYDEADKLIAAKNGKLLVPPDAWPEVCTGDKYKPPIECLGCNEIVTSTSLHHLHKGCGFGCTGCHNKTEGQLLRWLQARYPDVQAQQPQFKRTESTRGRLKFDFSHPSERWIVELDGNIAGGHFDDTPGNDCPVRDLEKEKWARTNGYQVIRCLQKDVWGDRSGWDNYLLTELAKWAARRAAGQPPGKAVTPQAPEYLGGVYKRLRSTVDTGPQLDDSDCTFCGATLGGFDVCMNCGTVRE